MAYHIRTYPVCSSRRSWLRLPRSQRRLDGADRLMLSARRPTRTGHHTFVPPHSRAFPRALPGRQAGRRGDAAPGQGPALPGIPRSRARCLQKDGRVHARSRQAPGGAVLGGRDALPDEALHRRARVLCPRRLGRARLAAPARCPILAGLHRPRAQAARRGRGRLQAHHQGISRSLNGALCLDPARPRPDREQARGRSRGPAGAFREEIP
jgi:hypothetical protein